MEPAVGFVVSLSGPFNGTVQISPEAVPVARTLG